MEPSIKSSLLPHLARAVFAFVAGLLLVQTFSILAFAVLAFVSSQVGYRKRTALLVFIPYVNWAFLGVICWRFMSENVTWAPRMDRPSSTIYTFWGGADNNGLHPFNDPGSWNNQAAAVASTEADAVAVSYPQPAVFPQPMVDLRSGGSPSCRGR